MREYTAIYERGKCSWCAYVPDLPGCVAAGTTRQGVERRIREAIEFHFEGLLERGEPVPGLSSEAGTVSISSLNH